MTTTVSGITAEQLLAMPDDGLRYELVNGELRRMSPAGGLHGRIAMKLGWRLGQFVEEHALGTVFAAETGFLLRRNPDTVRAPDVAFVKASAQKTVEGYMQGAPDLAAEVVSPSDSATEIEEKVAEWLGAGTRVVLVINSRQRAVTMYRALDDKCVLSDSETLDLSSVIPGFSVAVRDLFE